MPIINTKKDVNLQITLDNVVTSFALKREAYNVTQKDGELVEYYRYFVKGTLNGREVTPKFKPNLNRVEEELKLTSKNSTTKKSSTKSDKDSFEALDILFGSLQDVDLYVCEGSMDDGAGVTRNYFRYVALVTRDGVDESYDVVPINKSDRAVMENLIRHKARADRDSAGKAAEAAVNITAASKVAKVK